MNLFTKGKLKCCNTPTASFAYIHVYIYHLHSIFPSSSFWHINLFLLLLFLFFLFSLFHTVQIGTWIFLLYTCKISKQHLTIWQMQSYVKSSTHLEQTKCQWQHQDSTGQVGWKAGGKIGNFDSSVYFELKWLVNNPLSWHFQLINMTKSPQNTDTL